MKCKGCGYVFDEYEIQERYFEYGNYNSYKREYEDANFNEEIETECPECNSIVEFYFDYTLMNGTWEQEVIIIQD